MQESDEIYLKTYGIKLDIPWWKKFLLGFPILNLFMRRVKVRVDATVFIARGEPSHGTFRVLSTYYTIGPKKDCVRVHLPLIVAHTRHGFGTHVNVEFLNRSFLRTIKVDDDGYSKNLGFLIDKGAPVTAHVWEHIDASCTIDIPAKEGSGNEQTS